MSPSGLCPSADITSQLTWIPHDVHLNSSQYLLDVCLPPTIMTSYSLLLYHYMLIRTFLQFNWSIHARQGVTADTIWLSGKFLSNWCSFRRRAGNSRNYWPVNIFDYCPSALPGGQQVARCDRGANLQRNCKLICGHHRWQISVYAFCYKFIISMRAGTQCSTVL